jgi:signal peptidase I
MQNLMKLIAVIGMAALVLFGLAWYAGVVQGNFAAVLTAVTLFTGVYWVAERLAFLPQRREAAQRLSETLAERRQALTAQGVRSDEVDVQAEADKLLMQPWWLDWTAGLFPVLLVVFVLRSFVVEPFKIPSGSMVPTLRVGDLILVNKFHYGLRLPVLETKVWANHEPEKGDVMVFRYPPNPSLDYIKRVVGVPGDHIVYTNKVLTINGQVQPLTPLGEFFDADSMRYSQAFTEVLANTKHDILNDTGRPAFVSGASDFAFKDQCQYNAQGFTCTVPAGHYFMMGDNRDNSLDSRYWGFVPERNIVGKAFFVWMNFGDLGRIGAFD